MNLESDTAEPAPGRGSLDVLIVSQPVEYGVAVCVRQQTEAAVAAGHNVVVACPASNRGPLAGWITDAGAVHVVVNLARQPAVSDLWNAWKLRRLARGRDIVHLHSSKAGAIGRLAAATIPRRRRPAVVFTPHFWSWQVGGRLASLYRWIERLLVNQSDAIVAVSEQEAAGGRAVLGDLDHLTVVPNGVDRRRFSPEGSRAERDADVPLIVCVGRLSRQKGQDLAISALARSGTPNARLRLVGDEHPPGEADRLRRLAESLGVAARIEWWGKVADTAPEFRAADVVVAPSRWEGMSLVFLEAMACGSPMVVADVYGSDAIGPAGIIVPTDDADALAHAIDRVLGDSELRDRLAAAAADRSSSYDLGVNLARNLALWSRLAAERSGHRRRVRG